MPKQIAQLEDILRSRPAGVRTVTAEEDYALSVVRQATLGDELELLEWDAVHGLCSARIEGTPPIPGTEHPAAALVHLSQRTNSYIAVMLDLGPHLDDQRTLRAFRHALASARQRRSTLVLIDHTPEIPPVVASELVTFDIPLPDEEELEALLRRTLQLAHRERPIEIELRRSDFSALLRNLIGLSRRQAEQCILAAIADDRRLDSADLPKIVAFKRRAIGSGGPLEFVEAPLDLEQVGGLDRLKQWLADRRLALSDDAENFGLTPPRGMLLLGVQGAGKSLCAKAVATAWQRPLLRLDPGALYDRYVGESERRLREALRQAEAMAPVVLWIDEIEKGFASAASRSTDGGLSQRMFGTLLTWMNDHRAPVFIVATANDIEALPPELLRKGRFDEIFFVDLPGRAARRQIFSIHLKKRGRDPALFDLDRLADVSAGYSGAEIEQGIVSALHSAFATRADLSTRAVEHAIAHSPPLSVTMAERIDALRRWAHGRCVPAETPDEDS